MPRAWGSRVIIPTLGVIAWILLRGGPARGAINAGIEAGIAKRTASNPGNLDLGFGWQLHGEWTILPPLLNVGPYYTHYQLNSDSSPFDNAVFNTFGLIY
jgi:hypothetical protein